MTDVTIPNYKDLPAPKGYQSFIKDIGPTACDLYALTMTYAAWKLGYAEERVTTSHVFCRNLLSNGETYTDSNDKVQRAEIPYLVNAGTGLTAEWMDGWKWSNNDLRYLAQQNVSDGKGGMMPLFENGFLHWLSGQRLTLDIDAIPEGELIFPQEPVMRIKGLWWQQEVVEPTNLMLISSSTNLTTVAVQVRLAAQREARANGAKLVEMSAATDFAALSEMSLRRGLSIGGIQSSRAASIAGWDNSSNVYAGKCYNVPIMGTFAHAWVMLHDTEEEAFENWAKIFPGSTVFLPDTYSTVEGVKTAIRICKKYDIRLKAIRLDSGDMEYLSNVARGLLDDAGYKDARILATDNINRKTAFSLYNNAASEITGFGIGSEIAVNRLDPLLGFVQKLAARYSDVSTGQDELIREFIKLSETSEKTTLPGPLDVVRYIDRNGMWAGDTIIPAQMDIGEGRLSREIQSVNSRNGNILPFPEGISFQRMLQPWMQKGDMVQPAYQDRDAAAILANARTTCSETLARLDGRHKLLPPHLPKHYGVGIASELITKREEKIRAIRANGLRKAQLDRFDIAV